MRGPGNLALQTLSFVRQEFGGVDLNDQRLEHRLLRIVYALSQDPSRSLPRACQGWAATKAAYRFLSNPKVCREKVQGMHKEATRTRIASEPEVLIVQDTTVLNFTHHPTTQGIGKIGSRKWANQLLGAFVHSAVALRVQTHEVLGLVDQKTWIREDYRPEKETKEERQRRAQESQKWMQSAHAVTTQMAEANKLIFVFDREGDIWAVLDDLPDLGARFVIRAAWNRKLEEPGEHLFDQIQRAPLAASWKIIVPARGGRRKRTAQVAIRAMACTIRAPKQIDGEPVRTLNVVHVKEEAAPPGVEPLEWTLLTREPIGTQEELIRVVNHYTGRWKIEEWHKVLKSGCQMEARELGSWEGLDALLGIFSVIAWRLLALRDAARTGRPTDSKHILSPVEVKILRALDAKLKANASIAEHLRAVARLGGFLSRKSDGHPGWMTIWRGLTRLREMTIGYEVAKQER